MKPRPFPTKLITLRICEAYGPHVATQEATERALANIERSRAPDVVKGMASQFMAVAAVVPHCIIFAVDREEVEHAVGSLGELPPEGLGLPPLPFPNIAVEADSDTVWSLGEPDAGVAIRSVEFFTIHEIEQGQKWETLIWLRAEDDLIPGVPVDEHPGGLLPAIVTPSGMRWARDTSTMQPTERKIAKDGLWQLLIETVHYITARGVSLADAIPDRAARRRAQRGGYSLPEKLYWVRIDDTRLETTRGVSDRTYRCRWLVRGHWRHTSRTTKSWVKPYIKGPVGAPWRGRPMYHVPAATLPQEQTTGARA